MPQPFRTLTTSSMLDASKNQKYPESPVSLTAVPEPVEPSGLVQSAVTLKRPPFRQSAVSLDWQMGGTPPVTFRTCVVVDWPSLLETVRVTV